MLKFESNEIDHIKDGDVEYIKFKALEKYKDNLIHCITLRKGGCSSNVYESLNFRTSESNKDNIMKNIDIILKKLGIKNKTLYKAYQSHSENILYISNENKNNYSFNKYNLNEYDSYICNDINIPTIITTADCIPIIIYDPINNAYSNIHSGWKGTIKNICVKSAMLMMQKFNSKTDDMIVCIGPSIRKCCFSSREDGFKKNFIEKFKYENEYLHIDNIDDTVFYIDLQKIIKNELIKIGVKEENIHDSNICTCCNSSDFFSCRVSKKLGLDDFGTFGTIVMLK